MEKILFCHIPRDAHRVVVSSLKQSSLANLLMNTNVLLAAWIRNRYPSNSRAKPPAMRENSKSYAAVSNNLTRQIIEEFIESKGTFSYETILRTSITKSQRCTFRVLCFDTQLSNPLHADLFLVMFETIDCKKEIGDGRSQ